MGELLLPEIGEPVEIAAVRAHGGLRVAAFRRQVGLEPVDGPSEGDHPKSVERAALRMPSMELRPFRALRGDPRFKERRPGLWLDRQVFGEGDSSVVLPVLVGLVRLGEGSAVDLSREEPVHDAVSARVGALVSAKADSEPCLLLTRAPLSAALATTRAPDFTLGRNGGARHLFFRINDYAQHVELQGLVKNVEAALVEGRELWEAARQFAVSPAAEKLPGARFKLCAIVDESFEPVAELETPRGILGYSFEDPVY